MTTGCGRDDDAAGRSHHAAAGGHTISLWHDSIPTLPHPPAQDPLPTTLPELLADSVACVQRGDILRDWHLVTQFAQLTPTRPPAGCSVAEEMSYYALQAMVTMSTASYRDSEAVLIAWIVAAERRGAAAHHLMALAMLADLRAQEEQSCDGPDPQSTAIPPACDSPFELELLEAMRLDLMDGWMHPQHPGELSARASLDEFLATMTGVSASSSPEAWSVAERFAVTMALKSAGQAAELLAAPDVMGECFTAAQAWCPAPYREVEIPLGEVDFALREEDLETASAILATLEKTARHAGDCPTLLDVWGYRAWVARMQGDADAVLRYRLACVRGYLELGLVIHVLPAALFTVQTIVEQESFPAAAGFLQEVLAYLPETATDLRTTHLRLLAAWCTTQLPGAAGQGYELAEQLRATVTPESHGTLAPAARAVVAAAAVELGRFVTAGEETVAIADELAQLPHQSSTIRHVFSALRRAVDLCAVATGSDAAPEQLTLEDYGDLCWAAIRRAGALVEAYPEAADDRHVLLLDIAARLAQCEDLPAAGEVYALAYADPSAVAEPHRAAQLMLSFLEGIAERGTFSLCVSPIDTLMAILEVLPPAERVTYQRHLGQILEQASFRDLGSD